MNKNYIKKINTYIKQSNKEYTRKLIIDENGKIYFTDGFSVLSLFDTKYNQKNRNDVINNFEKDDNIISKQVINFYNNFSSQHFNKLAEIEKTENNYTFFKGNKKISFDNKKINRITKIISTDGNVSIFTSENNDQTICLVGKNGCAFLLGCKVF